MSPWADGLGRAGARAVQLLALTAVAAMVLYVLLALKTVVLAVVVALILACAVRPLVQVLTHLGWGNTGAAVTVFACLLGVMGGVITGVVLGVRGQLDDLVTAATTGWQHFQQFLATGPLPAPVDADTLNAALAQLRDYLASAGARQSALSGLTVASEVLTGAVLMVIVLFFFLKDGPRLWSFMLRWFTGNTRAKLAESGDRAVSILGSYVRGIALIATVDATFIGIGLWAAGVPLVVPLTIIVFLTAFVPIVGALVAGTLAALVALVTNGPVAALIVVLIVVVVNHLEGYFLHPVVMGHTLRLHALVVLLALSAGTVLAGVAGAVLAVPLTAVTWAVLQVWTTRYQTGEDPVLGPDPVSPEESAAARVSRLNRRRYQRMRGQDRPAPWATSPPPRLSSHPRISP
ncbi:AI-2E family transporter [Kocuria sp. CPCC 205263]|uniref:AI-2E family transporter n=1 Tax=Kocuria sp. CPCC 205263 TaxID=3073555 RepID=UPI0034D51E36